MPPVKPCSSRSRSKIRFAVCCCFFGRRLSSARILSMTAMYAPSFASPAALIAGSPAAQKTPSSSRQFADQSQTAAPPPARSAPQPEPHIEPSHRAPLASSLALRRRRHRASNCRIFTPAQPTSSAASLRDFCSGAYTRGRKNVRYLFLCHGAPHVTIFRRPGVSGISLCG